MTSLLYYSISENLSKSEIIAIDKRVARDREEALTFVRQLPSKAKRKTQKVITVVGLGFVLVFSNVESVKAVGVNLPPQQTVVISSDCGASKLISPSKGEINSDIKLKIMMPSLSNSIGSIRIRTKSDLQNSQWLKEFISTIRGGDEEKLIRSIISKVSQDDWDIPSINKILKKLSEVTLEIGTNDKLLRILAELEKPVPKSLFAEGFKPLLPRHRKLNKVEENKYSSPSIEYLLDSTKCYGHREAYNMPRSVSENFETNAVEKLSKLSLRNTNFKKEYKNIKDLINEGIHPVNIGKNSAFVSATKVLIKKPEGRYLVDVSDTHAEIVGVSVRGNRKCMSKFKTLMNELYNLDLTGY